MTLLDFIAAGKDNGDVYSLYYPSMEFPQDVLWLRPGEFLCSLLDLLVAEGTGLGKPKLPEPAISWTDAFCKMFQGLNPQTADEPDRAMAGPEATALLLGMALDGIRAGLKKAHLEEADWGRLRRMARLACLLWPKPVANGCDEFGRWFGPLPDDETDDLSRCQRLLTLEEGGGASSTSDGVYFPVALKPINVSEAKEARILKARVSRLPRRAGLPRLVLAPWTQLLLDPKEHVDKERGGLKLLDPLQPLLDSPQDAGGANVLCRLFKDRHYMLSLVPLEPASVPKLWVEGESLGLAVVLAAWALDGTETVNKQLVVTGAISDKKVTKVHGLRAKLNAVLTLAKETRCPSPWTLLVPEEGRAGLQSPEEKLVTIREAGCWEKLFKDKDLLTDPLATYLQSVSAKKELRELLEGGGEDQYVEKEITAFGASACLVGGALCGKEEYPLVPFWLPFHNDPEPAAVAWSVRLAECLLAHEDPALPVPLLLPLDEPKPHLSLQEQVLRWLLTGLKSWTVDVKPPTEAYLRSALKGWPGRLILVVYGPRSRALDYDSFARALNKLGQFLRAADAAESARPHLVFLASDGHHRDFLIGEEQQLLG